MRSIAFFLLLGLLFFSFVPLSKNVAVAENEEDEQEKVLNDVIDNVGLDDLEELLEQMKKEYGLDTISSVKDTVKKIVKGESVPDATYFFKLAVEILIGNASGYLAQASVILLIAVLLSVLTNLTSGFSTQSVNKIVYVACYGVVVVISLNLAGSAVKSASETIKHLSRFSEIAFPPLMTVMTALGSVSATGLYQPALTFFSVIVSTIIDKLILPGFFVCMALTIVGHMNENIKLGKMVKTVRSAIGWCVSFLFGLLGTVTTAKGIAGAGNDSLIIRSAKNALSGYVPIVGNYLKDGFDIVVSSCIVVKNAIGVTAVLLLVLIILSPLLKILLTILTLRLTASFAEPFGDARIPAMLYELSDCLKLLLVLLLCASFTLFIIIMLIILSCNGGVQ